jgi:hypothetical protein
MKREAIARSRFAAGTAATPAPTTSRSSAPSAATRAPGGGRPRGEQEMPGWGHAFTSVSPVRTAFRRYRHALDGHRRRHPGVHRDDGRDRVAAGVRGGRALARRASWAARFWAAVSRRSRCPTARPPRTRRCSAWAARCSAARSSPRGWRGWAPGCGACCGGSRSSAASTARSARRSARRSPSRSRGSPEPWRSTPRAPRPFAATSSARRSSAASTRRFRRPGPCSTPWPASTPSRGSTAPPPASPRRRPPPPGTRRWRRPAGAWSGSWARRAGSASLGRAGSPRAASW